MRKARRVQGPRFSVLEKYLHIPRPFSPSSFPLYRPRDSSISAPASPYSEVSPAEATFTASALSCIHPRLTLVAIPFLSFLLCLSVGFLILLSLSSLTSSYAMIFLLSRSFSLSFPLSFLPFGAMCIRKYESFAALSTTAFLELSAIVRE